MSCVYALAVGTLMFIDGNYCKTAPTAPVTQPASVSALDGALQRLWFIVLLFSMMHTRCIFLFYFFCKSRETLLFQWCQTELRETI